ncbi:hypothetical protein K2173_000641 [Erythroxylum novogranatense]|uniref:Uncharacterized protein n=1 Tax=Erythroxylum novogranatense TaxID=1862640 RepID=A0AAV8S850_9ROSI|nr:hypothetical protein K2173_000641 [Erythroxylum novogranatense]
MLQIPSELTIYLRNKTLSVINVHFFRLINNTFPSKAIITSRRLLISLLKVFMCLKRPHGSETLPKGIVTATSDLEMRALWGNHKMNPENQTNLLGMAVGIKQKESVDKIVRKFLSSGFVIMLFHYDGNVDAWKDFEWSDRCIHVSAVSQTKWWFAKRFLHPDIVSEYEYIFLWDEDLGVEHFNATRYLSIIKEEGLHISQPALGRNSKVHHALTRRQPRDRVHRRVYQNIRGTNCTGNSTGPPCAGFVEMMAPVFSKASWRCAWHMIPNDLVHGWGLDFRLGCCAQGKPTENVGVVDSEYVVHNSVPSLGGSARKGNTQCPLQAAKKELHSKKAIVISRRDLEIFCIGTKF